MVLVYNHNGASDQRARLDDHPDLCIYDVLFHNLCALQALSFFKQLAPTVLLCAVTISLSVSRAKIFLYLAYQTWSYNNSLGVDKCSTAVASLMKGKRKVSCSRKGKHSLYSVRLKASFKTKNVSTQSYLATTHNNHCRHIQSSCFHWKL